MGILSFDKPQKARSATVHNDMHASDTGVPGTFVPNMSDKDMCKWKAKKVGGSHPRVEVRKTVSGCDPSLAEREKSRGWGTDTGQCSAQVLLMVYNDRVVMSANGRIVWDDKTWDELQQAVAEAKEALNG